MKSHQITKIHLTERKKSLNKKAKEKVVEKQIQRITIIIPLSKMNPQQKVTECKNSAVM